MAGNSVTLEFAGDADKLKKAAKEAQAALDDVDKATHDTGTAMADESKQASRLEDRLGSLGSATTGAVDAMDSLAGGLQAVADVSDYSRARAARLERANLDVEQAMADGRQAAIDLEQSYRDLAQTGQDLTQAELDIGQAEQDREQAILDAQIALEEYNAVVKEHGKGSLEARQASLDLSQAEQDKAQALADAEQATLDYDQALTDQKQATEDGRQANLDARDAQLNLNDAMHEANPPQLQEWADKLNLITPLLTAVIGVTSLVTAAQWAWNAAQAASPHMWLIIGVTAVVAVIALLVWKWDWVKEKGKQAWRAVTDAGKSAWNWLKDVPGKIGGAFASLGSAISKPFIGAFNKVSDAWNSTVGSLSWSVPGWVPGIGGNSINVPDMPRFHTGGTVPGPPGTEVPIMAMAGEEVSLPGRQSAGQMTVIVQLDNDVLVRGVARGVSRRGGNVQFVLGGPEFV